MSQPLTTKEIKQLLKRFTDVEEMWAKAQHEDSVEMLEYLSLHHPMPLEKVWQDGKLRMYALEYTNAIVWFRKKGFSLKPDTDKEDISKILGYIRDSYFSGQRDNWDTYRVERSEKRMKQMTYLLIRMNPELSKWTVKELMKLLPSKNYGNHQNFDKCYRPATKAVNAAISTYYEKYYKKAEICSAYKALDAQKQALLDQILQIDAQKQQLLKDRNDLD